MSNNNNNNNKRKRLSTKTSSTSLATTADDDLSEYERKRRDNIRRNQMALASLNIPALAGKLSSSSSSSSSSASAQQSSSRARKRSKASFMKESDEPARPLRRSLRSQGLAPDGSTAQAAQAKLEQVLREAEKKRWSRKEGELEFNAANDVTDKENQDMISQIKQSLALRADRKQNRNGCTDITASMSLELRADAIKVVQQRVYCMRWLDCDKPVVAVGDKFGAIGLLDVTLNEQLAEKEQADPDNFDVNGMYPLF
jgi:hypothetical protein